MKKENIDDTNIESKTDIAIISIRGKIDDNPHYFTTNHYNVLNMTFDDITFEDDIYKAITRDQAKEIYNFIKTNINKGVKQFLIHCAAGISRSGAVGQFINDFYGSENFEIINRHINPNCRVYRYLCDEATNDGVFSYKYKSKIKNEVKNDENLNEIYF